MDQEDLDFIVDDGYNYDEDPTYEPNDEDDNDDDVSLSEYDEDDDLSLSEYDEDDDDGANVSGNEDLDYVTVNLPLPFLFDEAWFKKFQIMNLIKSGLKK